MDAEHHYTISELAEHAGVTIRTIRYYTAEGLLPTPDTRGKYARYSDEHLLRLQIIARLKDTYLPLSEIRNRLDGLETAELRALLVANHSVVTPSHTNASSYITQVLQTYPSAHRTIAEQPAQYQQLSGPLFTSSEPTPPMPMISPDPAQTIGHTEHIDDQSQKTVHDRWQRILLTPDIELHIREPQSEGLREQITQLIEQAHRLFYKKGERS